MRSEHRQHHRRIGVPAVNARRHRQPSCPAALAITLLALAPATVASAADVTITPGPLGLGARFAHFTDDTHLGSQEPDPCVSWRLAWREGDRIELLGFSPAAGAPCPPIDQYVALGELPIGQYKLVARFATDRTVYTQVVFGVGLSPYPFPGPFWASEVFPPRPTTTSPISVARSLWQGFCGHGLFYGSPPKIEGDLIRFDALPVGFPITCGLPGYVQGFFFDLPPLTPGLKTILWDGVPGLVFTVAEPTQSLFLGEYFPPFRQDQFEVRLSWRDRQGIAHQATGVRLTRESGAFSFFDGENVEFVIKILDGRALNGHWWVLGASMTDLAYTLTIRQSVNCEVCSPPYGSLERVYEGTAGENRNVLDTLAFADDPFRLLEESK
jgi:hypothetical protein